MSTQSPPDVSMWRLALQALARCVALLRSWRPTSLRGTLLMLVALPVFLVIQLINWCGLLLDELLFPRWRATAVSEPLFVLGVPRSGTTFLHRVLTDSDCFTTFRLWECLFAPSITQRVFWCWLARADRRIGAPAQRLLAVIQDRLLGGLDAIHVTRLEDAEEDYLALLPYLGAFILILPFPQSPLSWQLATADRDMRADERDCLMAFYRAIIQKHLYFHGSEKRFLSKNAAFAGLAGSLAASFPDARFIVCLREPERALPSQLSAISDGARWFHSARIWGQVYAVRFLEVFPFFYANLHRAMTQDAGARHRFVSMNELQHALDVRLPVVLNHLQIPLTAGLQSAIDEHARRARRYRSAHRVDTSGLEGIEDADLQRHFARAVPALPSLMKVIHRKGGDGTVLSC